MRQKGFLQPIEVQGAVFGDEIQLAGQLIEFGQTLYLL